MISSSALSLPPPSQNYAQVQTSPSWWLIPLRLKMWWPAAPIKPQHLPPRLLTRPYHRILTSQKSLVVKIEHIEVSQITFHHLKTRCLLVRLFVNASDHQVNLGSSWQVKIPAPWRELRITCKSILFLVHSCLNNDIPRNLERRCGQF